MKSFHIKKQSIDVKKHLPKLGIYSQINSGRYSLTPWNDKSLNDDLNEIRMP